MTDGQKMVGGNRADGGTRKKGRGKFKEDQIMPGDLGNTFDNNLFNNFSNADLPELPRDPAEVNKPSQHSTKLSVPGAHASELWTFESWCLYVIEI